MKIIINALAVKQGGQVTRLFKIIEYLDSYNNLDILILINHSIMIEKKLKNIKVIKYNYLLNPIIRILFENFYLKKIINNKKFDIYFTLSNVLPFTNFRIPMLLLISNLEPFTDFIRVEKNLFRNIKLYIQRYLILKSSLKATKIIALSEECKKYLILNNINKDKIVVISNGVETPNDSYVNIENNFFTKNNIKKNYILYVSNFNLYKNHLRLINAYKLLSNNIRNTHQLVLVGTENDKELIKTIKSIIRDDELNSIIILNYQNKINLQRLYNNALMFIFPSLIENCPNSLLEAMASGCPICVSNINSISNFCGNSAIYFDPLNINSMYESIKLLLRDDKLRFDMGLMSFNRSKLYSWPNFIDKLIAEFEVIMYK